MLKSVAKKVIEESHWSFISWHNHRFGLLSTLLGYVRLLLNNGIGRVRNTMTPTFVYIRPGTADQNVFDEIFIAKEYELELNSPLFIIDAGAHIGLSSVFFAIKYPGARIVALEPEDSNYQMLVRNSETYKNIHPVKAGLWSHKTFLSIQNPDESTWGFRVAETSNEHGIPALGVPDVMSMFNATHIDVLKMDIEGSELEVLQHSEPWLDGVQTLIIELHDRLRPGCTEALEHAIGGLGFSRSVSGESVVLSKLGKL